MLTFLKNLDKSKTDQLSYEVNLVVGAKYMITSNLKVADGLVNGTCGVLKHIMRTKCNKYAEMLWFDFKDASVGAQSRKENREQFRRYADEIKLDEWTPIFAQVKRLKLANETGWWVERTQFPVSVSEAITIHKSQGQTYRAVAVDISRPLKRSLLYVALSRVGRLQGLYLIGKRSIVHGCSFKNYTTKQREQALERDRKTNTARVEMERMRKDSRLVNIFPFLETNPLVAEQQSTRELNNDNSLGVIFHNVAGLARHWRCIKSDFGFMNASIIMLAECRTKVPRDRTALPLPGGYSLMHMTGSARDGVSNGIAIYIKESIRRDCFFVADNSPRQDGCFDSSDVCEMGLLRCRIKENNVIYFCCVYRHPNASDFYKKLRDFLRTHIGTRLIDNKFKSKVFVLGDFNIDLLRTDKDKRVKEAIEKELHLRQLVLVSTTDRETCIDWCMTNAKSTKLPHEAIVYESYFSDHKPIWLYVK